MSGLAGITAAAAGQSAAEASSLVSPISSGPEPTGFAASQATQLAFAEAVPSSPVMQAASVQSNPTLGDRILDSLSRIGSSFGRLDSLAPQMMTPDRAGISAPITQTEATGSGDFLSGGPGVGGGIIHPSGNHDLLATTNHTAKSTDALTTLNEIQQQGMQIYNDSISRQVQLTNAEFETHVITVASQDMASTLKSLLSQGG